MAASFHQFTRSLVHLLLQGARQGDVKSVIHALCLFALWRQVKKLELSATGHRVINFADPESQKGFRLLAASASPRHQSLSLSFFGDGCRFILFAVSFRE